MTILDRYILRSFFFNFIGWNLCFVGIFVVFDLFTNFDSLIQAGKAAGSVAQVIFLYYFFKSIPIVLLLGSVLSLLAAMVTVALLMRNNELVPIQAAGISTLRIVRPLIIAVLCLTAMFCLTREFLLPNIQDRIVMEIADYAEKEAHPSMLPSTMKQTSSSGEIEFFDQKDGLRDRNLFFPQPLRDSSCV